MSQSQRRRFKIVLIGPEKTGKTSFVSKFLFDYFPPANQEFLMDRHQSKIVKLKGKNIEIQLTDMHSLVFR